MNYRSFADLDACIAGNLHKVPCATDLIVGIPRSGLMAASVLALHLNLPLTDVAGLIEDRMIGAGQRMQGRPLPRPSACKHIFVLDDSILTGAQMERTRFALQHAGVSSHVLFGAIYATEESVAKVDVWFEICAWPRVFAWNLMGHVYLEEACIDLDGVLCTDPMDNENDDGPNYIRFLQNARPLLRPSREVGAIITCRLEKYRDITQSWLDRQSVKYRELVMWDLPDKLTRQKRGGHAEFKAMALRERPWARFFIESSARQAQQIADGGLRPVVCIENQRVYLPGTPALLGGAVAKIPRWFPKSLSRVTGAIKSRLLRI